MSKTKTVTYKGLPERKEGSRESLVMLKWGMCAPVHAQVALPRHSGKVGETYATSCRPVRPCKSGKWPLSNSQDDSLM
jgi:hypothetical protein